MNDQTTKLTFGAALLVALGLSGASHAKGVALKKLRPPISLEEHTIQDAIEDRSTSHTVQDYIPPNGFKWWKQQGPRGPVLEGGIEIDVLVAGDGIETLDRPIGGAPRFVVSNDETVRGDEALTLGELATVGPHARVDGLRGLGTERRDLDGGGLILGSQTPAPGALGLIGLGALALFGRRRR